MFHSFIKTFIILEKEKQEQEPEQNQQTGGSDVSEPQQIAGFKAPIEQEIKKDPNKILYHKANSLSVIAFSNCSCYRYIIDAYIYIFLLHIQHSI